MSWDLRGLVTFPVVLTIFSVSLFLFLVPTIKLLRRTGRHPIWCLLALFPGLNFIALWIFAFKPWPTDGAIHRKKPEVKKRRARYMRDYYRDNFKRDR